MKAITTIAQRARQREGDVLQRALRLHDQPRAAEQGVTEHERDAREHRERSEPCERAAQILAVLQRQALDDRPSMTPCANAVAMEPTAKHTPHSRFDVVALKRNSNDTPRTRAPRASAARADTNPTA